MPDDATFWNKAAAKYARSAIGDPQSYEYTLGRTRSHIGGCDRVLEIGCGTGSTALALAGDVGTIIGTDISQEMVAIAEEKAKAAGVGNAEFRVIPAEDAVLLATGCGAVLAFSILHLLRDPEAVISRVHEGLPAGGVFISKTPCLGEPALGIKRFAFRVLVPVMRLIGKAPFVQSLSNAQVEGMITNAGFEIIETCSRPAISRYVVARKP